MQRKTPEEKATTVAERIMQQIRYEAELQMSGLQMTVVRYIIRDLILRERRRSRNH